MPNEYLDKVNLDGTTYDIKDTISGYTTNTGTVTSVGVQNGGGLTVSGSPITSSGTITVGHSNSVTAQTTQAVYPIAIDAQGHISGYGTAVDIPTPETFLVNATITTVTAGGVPAGGTTDKSATEIYNAAASGLIPLVKVPMQTTGGTVYMIAPLALAGDENDSVYARFVYEDQSNPSFQYATLQVIGNAFTIEFTPPYLKSGGAGMGGLSIENQDGTLDITHPDLVNNETIAIDHEYLGTGQTTQAVYPITVDDFGHIQTVGSAVTIPAEVTESTVSGWGFTKNAGTVTSVTAGTGLTGGTISTSGTVALDTTRALTTSDITTGTDTTNKLVSAKTIADALSGFGGGTVTSVGLSNASGESDFTITGSPITSNGTITIEHSNSTTAKSTQAVYPITFDKHGHITGSGTAVTIPTVNNGALKLQKNTGTASSIYTANQSGDSTLKFTTTSVGSASGWSAGTVPTLGDNIPADDITAWTTNTPTTPAAIDVTKFNGGSFTRGSFSGGSFTQGTDSFTANTPTTIDTTKFSGGSFTRGAFSGGSFTQGTDSFTANTPTAIDTSKFNAGSYTQGTFSAGSLSMSGGGNASSSPATLTISFTAPTHASDSFTAPSLGSGFYSAGTAATFSQGTDSFTAATHGNDSFTAASLNAGFYTAGTAATFTQGTDSFTAATHGNDSFTPASLSTGFYTAGTKGSSASLSYTAKSIPNVTGVGTAPSLTVSSTTVVNDITTV